MAAEVWLKGENGALLSFGTPLPEMIARRLAAGQLTQVPPPEPPAPPPPAQTRREPGELPKPIVPRPRPGAGKTDWERYAVSQGMPRRQAQSMSRAELAEWFRVMGHAS